MRESHEKESAHRRPIERHDTASWADTDEKKPVSKVSIPKETGTIEARDYVNQNQK